MISDACRLAAARACRDAVLARRAVCPLTVRQVEILQLFASGEVSATKQVALVLGLKVSTVRNHVNLAATAMGTSGLTQTLVVALREGWVQLPGADTEKAA